MRAVQNEPIGPAEVADPSSRSNKISVGLSVATAMIVVLIVIAIGSGLIPISRNQTDLAVGSPEPAVPAVAVVTPKPGRSGSGLALPAEIKPWVEAPIYARANGYLKNRFVDIGSHVEAGELLAEIDAPEQDQELERDRALLAQAEAALELARLTAARWELLSKTKAVSDQENDEKQADFRLKAATAESARAEVRRLEKLTSFKRVTAPFAGRITIRNIDSGDLIVAAGGKELFHLAQTQKLRVFVQVPQAMARSIHIGQIAEMTIPELPGRKFPAKVIRTAGVIADDSRTLMVELEVDNPKEEILAGGYAQMRFTEANSTSALTVPANTVLFRSEGPQIGVVHDNGLVEIRTVKLGRDLGQAFEILAGVNKKDRVILNPCESLANGDRVSANEADGKQKDR